MKADIVAYSTAKNEEKKDEIKGKIDKKKKQKPTSRDSLTVRRQPRRRWIRLQT